jgi:hypothetical protein
MPGVSPDPGNDEFIAWAGKADFLVTGNKKHFPQARLSDARVVNAGELLEFITLEREKGRRTGGEWNFLCRRSYYLVEEVPCTATTAEK